MDDVVYDAFFHSYIAARVKYEWSTDPDIPSQKALKVTINWSHRDPEPGVGIYTYDVKAGYLNYNYIVQRNGKLTFRDPAPSYVLFKGVGQV